MLLFTLATYAFPQSEDCKRQLQYSSAKTKGNMALVLTSINIFYNFAVICIVIVFAARFINPPCYYCPTSYGKNTTALCILFNVCVVHESTCSRSWYYTSEYGAIQWCSLICHTLNPAISVN